MKASGGREQPIDWEKIDSFLMREHKLRPWEIDALTLSEIALYLEKNPGRSATMSHDEISRRVTRWLGLTAREKLESGRRRGD